MGCWGYGIRESDDALDHESDIVERAGLDLHVDDLASAKARAAFEASLDANLAHIDAPMPEREEQRERFQRAVAYQVLASLLMGAGCAFSEEVRQKLMAGCSNDGEYKMGILTKDRVRARLLEVEATEEEIEAALVEYDGKRNRGRVAAIGGLLELLKSYDITGGTPLEVESKGLFETMDEVFAGGVRQ